MGDGPALERVIRGPGGVGVDGHGTVYVPDESSRILSVDTSGYLRAIAGKLDDQTTGPDSGFQGGYADGQGEAARFNRPEGLCVVADGLLVADTRNNRIRKLTFDGLTSTLAGSGVAGWKDGSALEAAFSAPYGITTDASGAVYVSEYDRHDIRRIAPDGTVTTLAGSGQPGFKDGPGAQAMFDGPQGLACDGSNLYVADTANRRIRKVASDGTVTTVAGDGTQGYQDGPALAARFDRPCGVVVTARGDLFVTDFANQCIRRISAGQVTTLVGTTAGFADGDRRVAAFDFPTDLTMDSSGSLYVSDLGNNAVRKVTFR